MNGKKGLSTVLITHLTKHRINSIPLVAFWVVYVKE